MLKHVVRTLDSHIDIDLITEPNMYSYEEVLNTVMLKVGDPCMCKIQITQLS